MFLVSVRNGDFDLRVFLSVMISLASVSTVLVMLVDRGPVRAMCLGDAQDHPRMVKYLARGLTVILVGNYHKTGNMKQLVNYSCHMYAHFFWATILRFSSITVRIVALCWLLSTSEAYKIVVFGILFTIRMLFIMCFDPKFKSRALLKNVTWAIVYTALTVVWDKDESASVASHRALAILNIISSIENVIFIGYAGFLSTHTEMSIMQKVTVSLTAIACMMISWYLLVRWLLPVHFPELYVQTRGYGRRNTLVRPQWTVGTRASEFDTVNPDTTNSEDSRPVSIGDVSQPMRHSIREKSLKLMRQQSSQLNRDIDVANGDNRERADTSQNTWWSSLNKNRDRKRKQSIFTIDREYSFSAFSPSGNKSKSSYLPDLEGQEDSEEGMDHFDVEGNRAQVVSLFRENTLSSIRSHRDTKGSRPLSSSSFFSDLTESTGSTSWMTVDSNLRSSQNQSNVTSSNPRASGSYNKRGTDSVRFDYDHFLTQRDTTFAPDGQVQDKGNVVFEMEAPAVVESNNTKNTNTSHDVKKHHFMKFKFGNAQNKKNRRQGTNQQQNQTQSQLDSDEKRRKDML